MLRQLDSHTLKDKVAPLPHTIYKVNSRGVNNLNVGVNVIKALKEKLNLYDGGLGNGLLDYSKI